MSVDCNVCSKEKMYQSVFLSVAVSIRANLCRAEPCCISILLKEDTERKLY